MDIKSTTWEECPDFKKQILPASIPTKIRWQPTVEFIMTIVCLGDAAVIFAAFSLGFWMRFDSGLIPLRAQVKPFPTFFEYFNLIAIATLLVLGAFGYQLLYGRHCLLRYHRTAKAIITGSIYWLVVSLGVSFFLKSDPPISRVFTLTSFFCVVGAMLAWRYAFLEIMRCDFFMANLRQRVVFVGWGVEAEQLETEIRNDSLHPYEIIGCFPSPQGRLYVPPPSSVPVLGDYHDLVTYLEQRCADIVILADLYVPMGEIIGLVNLCELEFAKFKIIPSYFQSLVSGLRLETISGVPVLGVSDLPLDHPFNRLIKRVLDIVGAIVGLILTIPFLIFFGARVYRESPGPIIYRQIRTGRNGGSFWLFKIRSMRMNAEQNGAQWTKENDPRRLKIGALMRKWNIDETPQFWNVLKGEMSLVGPRPEQPEFISDFKNKIPHYHARHTCLPGMTGWAQVNGWRGNTSLESRIRHDIWYVENWSIGLDLRIMLRTFRRQRNAY